MFRSILAVLSGVVVWGVLWAGANAGLAGARPEQFDANGVTTDPVLLLAFMAISAGLSVLSGWLCATIARRSPMRHVSVLAALQLGIGIAVQAGVWTLLPIWYHLTFLALVVPMHLLGGWIRTRRQAPGAARDELVLGGEA